VGDPELLKSCGFAAPWIEMQILDDDCNVLPAGEVGEICLKSPSTMIRYVNRPEETATALAGGWLHSGDIGLMDDRGYLYIKDRKTDMIISGGFNVYPKEVENALMRHPDVVECAVFGSADEVWGEAVSAVVQIRPGSTLDLREIQEHCKQHIGSYKKPRRVRIGIEPLPTSEHGKILRRVVREDFLAREFEGERA
jgi:acyl-CoA synthetase (AMP-forming)/AMP-acid ligase II